MQTPGIMVDSLIRLYEMSTHELRIFMSGVVSYIGEHPDLNRPVNPIIHSFKIRLKDPDHLRDKLIRKLSEGRDINTGNFFSEVTDLAGVRILHLFQDGFGAIDGKIREKIDAGDWHLAETPKAYTWDPEAGEYFSQFDVDVSKKATSYTSVHYLIKPREKSIICCEVQVRTLFEEIWGEVDHQINYPHPSKSIACREQLKVLSKITGAGSRLLDALSRVQVAEQELQEMKV